MTIESQTAPVVTPAPEIIAPPAGVVTRRVMATIGVVILVLDQLTKLLVRTQIALNDSIEIVPGFLNLVHVRNTGAAFGFLNSVDLGYKQFLMTGIALVALCAIGLYASRVGSREPLARAGMALILGGAVGNLIDRASVGYVVDFVDAYWGNYHFWAFNVADSAITVGAFLLILDMFVATNNDVSTPV
jgi:signal peptidase II